MTEEKILDRLIRLENLMPETRLKDLEELDIDRRLKGLFATLWYGSDHKGEALVHRVEDLETKAEEFTMPEYLEREWMSRFSTQWQSITKLERTVKDLERQSVGFANAHNADIQGLEKKIDTEFGDLLYKIKDLEEWKRQSTWHNPEFVQTDIIIDKKVWEDIKRDVALLDTRYFVTHRLKDAIKKADPSWCDKD